MTFDADGGKDLNVLVALGTLVRRAIGSSGGSDAAPDKADKYRRTHD
jgi:hypothetical protein